MKFAFLSDIHSNLYALKSVLKDIQKQDVDDIYCLGDIVGYHSFPNEVIDFIIKNNIISIKGNHDKDISELCPNSILTGIKRWTYDELNNDNLSYLKSLPEEKDLSLSGLNIKLVHGSPDGITNYLFEDSDESLESINKFSGDILICAHTHFPYIKFYGNKTLINTGSVGKPKIGKPKASYILIEILENVKYKAYIKYVSYEHEKAAEDMLKKGLSAIHAEELIKGSVI